ncbi:MAG: HNH endonuclease [Planctomycetes bacterium]|nr:HNH endonuclease [Planctomycetota bacterium]
MTSVLVLNASFEPLNVVSVRRAVVLLLKDKAELVEAVEAVMRAEHIVLPTPSVIRLVSYVRIPYRMRIPVSRRGVLARDRFTCQYCGGTPGRSALTIDHVVPRSRGGPKRWENLVAACARCNRRKGGRLPDEAGMKLLSRPESPRYVALAFVGHDGGPDGWRKYLQPGDSDADA